MTLSSLVTWKKAFNDRRTVPLSEKEWRKKNAILERFLKHISEAHSKEYTPDELLALDYEFIEDCIMSFQIKLQSVISHNSSTTYAATVQGFFTANRIRLKKHLVTPGEQITTTSKLYVDVPVFRLTNEGKYEGFSASFTQWIDALPIAARVVAYCSLSSGADVADILELKVGQVNSQKEDRHFLTGNRMKASKRKVSWPFNTCISKEATKLLRSYVRSYRKDAKDEDFVFLQSRVENTKGTKKQNRLLPKNVQDIFRLVAENQGLIDGGKNPFGTKRLRHAFTTACTAFAKLPSDAVDTLTGHVGTTGKGYLDKPKPIIVGFYSEVEKYVTVHGGTIPQDMQEALSEYEDKLYLRDVRIERLESEKSKIEGRMDGMEQIIQVLYESVDEQYQERVDEIRELNKPDPELEKLKKEHRQKKSKK